MKLLIFIIAILFASIALTLLAMENPGYVLIAREPWSVEMPLTLFGLLFIIAAALASFSWNALARMLNIPREVARWRRLRHNRKVQEGLTQGLTQLMEGNWSKAEKRLLSDLRHNQTPLLNYLAAAYAAQHQGDNEKRDEYLALAHQSSPDDELAIGMTKAQLHFLAHQYERALASLTQLRVHTPNHGQVLKLLAQVYRELRDWASLVNLIPELRKHKALTPQEVDVLELQTHRELLILSLPVGSIDVLEKAWQVVPKTLREHPTLISIYARHLIKQQQMDSCEALLNNAIKRKWDDELVYLYGITRGSNPVTQMEAAESWLYLQPDNPVLLLTLGRLALANKLRAKALGYFEKCIALRELPEAYSELGSLLEQSGQTDKAREYYQRGLKIAGQLRGETEKTNSFNLGNGMLGSHLHNPII